MTIGWVEQFIDGGVIVDGIEDPTKSTTGYQLTAAVMGSFLSGEGHIFALSNKRLLLSHIHRRYDQSVTDSHSSLP